MTSGAASGVVMVDLGQDTVTQSKELGIAFAEMGTSVGLLLGPQVVLDALLVAFVTIAKSTGQERHGADALPGALSVLENYAAARQVGLAETAGRA